MSVKVKLPNLKEMRKAVVAALGFAVEAVNAGVIHGAAAHWVSVVVGAATLVGVYVVKNDAAAAPPVNPAPIQPTPTAK